VADTRRYLAEYAHDGRGWVVQFRAPDISTFGRTLEAARRHARSALAVHLETASLEEAGVEVVDSVRLPPGVGAEVRRLVERRSQAEALRTEVAATTRRAAADLRRIGLSTRDVGELLGISGGRVAQIEREAVAS